MGKRNRNYLHAFLNVKKGNLAQHNEWRPPLPRSHTCCPAVGRLGLALTSHSSDLAQTFRHREACPCPPTPRCRLVSSTRSAHVMPARNPSRLSVASTQGFALKRAEDGQSLETTLLRLGSETPTSLSHSLSLLLTSGSL